MQKFAVFLDYFGIYNIYIVFLTHVLSLSDRLLFLIAVKMTVTVESQQANGDHDSSYKNTSSGGDPATPDQVRVHQTFVY